MRPPMPPDPCPYCGELPRVVYWRDELYPYRRNFGKVWICPGCKARVGCHKRGTEPLGRLADYELRRAKNAAHRAFDPIWQEHRLMTRSRAYAWLAAELGVDEAHIGWLDVEGCRQVVALARRRTAQELFQ